MQIFFDTDFKMFLKRRIKSVLPLMVKRWLTVYMDINNKCNLRCRMCYFSLPISKPASIMNISLFKAIAEQVFFKTRVLHLSCAAEPLLVRNFHDYLHILKPYSIPVTRIVTNGLLLNEKIIRGMIDTNISELRISLDGSTKETYEQIRQGSHFERVVENIRLFQSLKADSGVTIPKLSILCTLMRSNITDLPGLVHLAKDLGADSLKTSHLIPFEGLNMMEESLINNMEETNAILDKSRRVGRKIDLNFECVPNFTFKETKRTHRVFTRPYCTRPFDFMYISSEGDVVPCIMMSMKKYNVGNFLNQTFDEIWNGGKYNNIRQLFDNKLYTEHCRNCAPGGREYLKRYVFTEAKRDDISSIV